jgi:hypothetical protein
MIHGRYLWMGIEWGYERRVLKLKTTPAEEAELRYPEGRVIGLELIKDSAWDEFPNSIMEDIKSRRIKEE